MAEYESVGQRVKSCGALPKDIQIILRAVIKEIPEKPQDYPR